MRLPVSSAAWMANSATSVLPAPVGAETITDWPAATARHASIWKSSSGNGARARNRSNSPDRSIAVTLPRPSGPAASSYEWYDQSEGGMASKVKVTVSVDERLVEALAGAGRRRGKPRSHLV